MLSPYQTVRAYGEAQFELSRSRFVCHAARAESEEEAAAFVTQIKRRHREANHNCSAYIIGKQGQWQKADDDGEPSGTAGKPLLELLKKQHLTDTVLVVSRYFGGIKLGAGGLIRAYGRGGSEAVQAAGVVRQQPYVRLEVTCDYALLAILENNLHQAGYAVAGKEFAAQVTLQVLRRPDDAVLARRLADWSGGTAAVREAGEEYVAE